MINLGAGVEAILRASTSSTGALLGTGGPITSGALSGTTTNDNAAVGVVGEYVRNGLVVGSALGLATNIPANVTSIPLTAGDWNVTGNGWFTGNAATNVAYALTGISTVSATFPTVGNNDINEKSNLGTPFTPNYFSLGVGPVRVSLAASATIYLVVVAGFTVSTCSAFGEITARRIR